jgi:hypothetical protein
MILISLRNQNENYVPKEKIIFSLVDILNSVIDNNTVRIFYFIIVFSF